MAIGLPSVTLATTNEEPNNEEDTSGGGSGDEEGGTNGGTPSEPEPEPETPPVVEPEPETPAPTEPEPEPEPEPIVEPEPDELPLEENTTTPSPMPSLSPELPPQCAEGTTALECLQDMIDEPDCGDMTPLECLEDYLNNPPITEPTCPPGQFPTTPGDASTCVDCEGECPPETPPPTEEEGPDQDCLFNPSLPKCASDNGECPDGFFQNEDENCVPEHPEGCPDGYHSHEDDETGQCIPNTTPCQPGYVLNTENKPTCEKKEFYCQTHHDSDKCKFDSHEEREHKKTIIIKKIIKQTNSDGNNNGHHHESFPEVDIVGISAKENGDAQICLMNIDDDNIQCQDFGMPDDRVSGDLWRIIETDHGKDYDDGDTGSDDVDDAIDDIKSQDFSALDDASNHDFDIDLAWIAISPDGEGVVCLTEDSSGKGKALCEPFKVSSQEISGQITEGVQFT